LEFLQHSDKKPRTIQPSTSMIQPRKDLFDHFDRKVQEYRNEAVGTGRHTSRLRRASKLYIFIDICIFYIYYNVSVPASVVFNDVTNYAIGLGQGHPSL